MGIPYYFYKLSKKYKEILQTPSQRADYLMFDFNSLLHPLTAEYLKTRLDLNESVEHIDVNSIMYSLEYTRKIVEQVDPRLGVYIVLDGVAPRAKLKQQRHRRFKSCYIEKRTRVWDSNKITPGTEYMHKLDEILKRFCNQHGYNYSSWKEPGEGEHKIFKILSTKGLIKQDETVYIYGMDADLIILSLLYSQHYKVVLFRDDPSKREESLKEQEQKVDTVNIDKLKRFIVRDLRPNEKRPDIKRLVNDYSLLMCLVGNDFLENIPTLYILDGSLDLILDIYRQLDKYITTESGEINYKVFLEVLYKLAKNELFVYSRWCEKQVKFKEQEQLDILEEEAQVTIYNNSKLMGRSQSEIKKRYYTFYNIEDPIKTAENYVRGLQWVMGYYNNHRHNNWSYVYEYHTSPFLSDIIQYIKQGVDKTLFIEDKPVKPLQQLFLVLPETSLKALVKSEDKYKIDTLLNIEWIKGYFDCNLVMDYIQKDSLWKGRMMHPDLIPLEALMLLEYA